MNSFESISNSKNQQEKLAGELLGGDIEASDFLGKLIELDQNTPDRHQSINNLRVLKDDRIEDYFKSSDLEDRYRSLLSLSHFHVAQIVILEEGDKDRALNHFHESLSEAEEGSEWCHYVSGTVAYLEEDRGKLQKEIDTLAEGGNKEILENFLKDLESGYSDYKSTYGS